MKHDLTLTQDLMERIIQCSPRRARQGTRGTGAQIRSFRRRLQRLCKVTRGQRASSRQSHVVAVKEAAP